MNDSDDLPGWEMQEQNERQRFETEELKRLKPIAEQFRRECAVFEDQSKAFEQRLNRR